MFPGTPINDLIAAASRGKVQQLDNEAQDQVDSDDLSDMDAVISDTSQNGEEPTLHDRPDEAMGVYAQLAQSMQPMEGSMKENTQPSTSRPAGKRVAAKMLVRAGLRCACCFRLRHSCTRNSTANPGASSTSLKERRRNKAPTSSVKDEEPFEVSHETGAGAHEL